MGFRKKSTKELVQDGAGTGEPLAPKKKKNARKPKEKKAGMPMVDRLKSKGFLGGLCVVLALLLAFVLTPAMAARKAVTVEVVTLATDAALGSKITSGMLTTREMGAINLPAGTVTDPAEAVDKYLTMALLEGDILTTRHMQSEYPTEDPELLNLGGRLAMSVSLAGLAESVSSKLRAGDIIQLLAVLEDQNGPSKTGSYTATIVPELQAVEVLIVTNNKAMEVTRDGETGDNQIATVVLSVDRQQAAVLAGLNAKATLHAALVSRGDEEVKEAYLKQQATLLAEVAAGPLPDGGEPVDPVTGEGGGE